MARQDGTVEDDTLTGSAEGDIIVGHDGDDYLIGNGVKDRISPGPGDDTIDLRGASGSIEISPDGGHDKVFGMDPITDKIVFNGFDHIHSMRDLLPFVDEFPNDPFGEDGRMNVIIDVAAAGEMPPGSQSVILYDLDLDSVEDKIPFQFDLPLFTVDRNTKVTPFEREFPAPQLKPVIPPDLRDHQEEPVGPPHALFDDGIGVAGVNDSTFFDLAP